MRVSLITAFFLSLLIFTVSGQSTTGRTDSLRSLLNTDLPVEQRVSILNQLGWEYRDIRPDSSLFFSNQAMKLADKAQFISEYIQAINYMGIAYRNLGVYSKAFERYLEALKLAEENDIEEQRGYALINLGNLYLFQTNFQGAIRYFIQALDQAQKLGNRRMQAYCFINLGRSYEGTNEFGQAELYITQAIDIRKQLGDEYGVIAAQIELADIYRKKGELQKALDKAEEIISQIDEEENPRVLILAYLTLSRIYHGKDQFKRAEYYAFEGLRLAKSVSSRYDERNVLEQLSQIFSSKNDFKGAYENHVNYAELNQQLFSEENIRKIEQLKNQYEIEKQEAENEFLKKQADLNQEIINRQRIIITLAIVGILLVVVIALSIYRASVIRKKLVEKIQNQKDQILEDKNTIEKQSSKLQQLDEAKSRFFANVSHDLRSPLSLIMGNIEMIEEDEDTYLSPKAKKHLEVGFKNSKRLLYLTDEINDITRLEEGKLTIHKEPVRINSYVKVLCDMFIDTAEQKGISLTFSSKMRDFESVMLDSRQFEKIFYNLISNSIRHTQKGGKIEIGLQNQDGLLEMKVSDTGEGIDKATLPNIFDRFYQSADNQYQTREGLGIGLALVKELVELHNGTITVESTKGVGTTFIVILPLAGKESEIVPEVSPYMEDQKNSLKDLNQDHNNVNIVSDSDKKESTVLIVDDHPEIRYYIRQILESKFNIIEASHGLEALQTMDDREVDLIITDLMMPWMDGFELIESINSNEKFKKIPLLVVSARISGSDKEKVLYHGINDYLQKPFSRKELILRVENLIKQKEKYAEQTQNVFSTLVKDNLIDVEKDILSKLETEVTSRISDPNLSVLSLSDAMAASERQVYRLVKKLTGLTPNEYIREVRLQYVDYLIRNNKVKNPTEAAKSIGIKNVTTFSRQYEKKFGVKPAELLD